MRTFIRRNRYLIVACALLFAAAAGLGLFAAQANAAGVDAAVDDALEQPADGIVQKVADKEATPAEQEASGSEAVDGAAG